MASVQIGDAAPDVSLAIDDGTQLRLSDLRGQQVVVLFFYPKDNTSICTAEACAFRDAYEDFVAAGATVIGVSSDSAESHRSFSSRHGLGYRLAADEDGVLRKTFGVPKTLGLLPGRVTYVIDREGIVRMVFSAQMSSNRHVEEALAVVRSLVS